VTNLVGWIDVLLEKTTTLSIPLILEIWDI